MGKLIHAWFGGRYVQMADCGDGGDRVHIEDLYPAQVVVVKTITGSTYRFRVLDPEEGLVEVLEGNPSYFSKSSVRCIYIGATAFCKDGLHPKMVVNGMAMNFAGVPVLGGEKQNSVITSKVVSWHIVEPPNVA